MRPLWSMLLIGLLATSATAQDGAALIRDLTSDSVPLRRAAANRIRNANRAVQLQALATLIDRLPTEPDGQVRLALFDILTALGPAAEPAIPALVQTLKTDAGVRGAEALHQDFRAAFALAMIGKPAVPALRAVLVEPKESVRAEVIMALGRIGPDASAAVPNLVPLLGTNRDRIGREASHALGQIGGPALDPLLLLSVTGDLTTRLRAIAGLGQVARPDQRVSAAVLQAARDPDPQVRTQGLQALTRFDLPAAAVLPVLRAGLSDPVESVQHAAAGLVCDRRDWLAPLAPDLAANLLGSTPAVADHAAFLLGVVGRESGPRLLAALADSASRIDSIGAALAAIGRPVVPLLGPAIRSPDPRVRRGAALALGQVRPVDPGALTQLVGGLPDPDEAVRGDFLTAIGHLGSRGRDAVPAVRALLHDPAAANRLRVLAILARSAPRDDQLVADLIGAISDDSPAVQEAAIVTLRALGPLGRPALPRVVGVIGSPIASVRLAAVLFIESLGGAAAEAVPALADRLGDPDPQVRLTTAQTLGKLGKPAQPAYGRLAELFGDDQPSVREVAALAVGNLELDADTLRPDLSRALKDTQFDVRKAAIRSVGRLGPAGVVFLPDLIALATTKENAKLIERPLKVFERTGPAARSLPELVALLDADPVAVRLLAIKFLGLAGPAANGVLPQLDRLRDDPSAEVRAQAKTACALIRPEPEPPATPGERP